MEYESLMRKRKLQKSPYLFNFLVLFHGIQNQEITIQTAIAPYLCLVFTYLVRNSGLLASKLQQLHRDTLHTRSCFNSFIQIRHLLLRFATVNWVLAYSWAEFGCASLIPLDIGRPLGPLCFRSTWLWACQTSPCPLWAVGKNLLFLRFTSLVLLLRKNL